MDEKSVTDDDRGAKWEGGTKRGKEEKRGGQSNKREMDEKSVTDDEEPSGREEQREEKREGRRREAIREKWTRRVSLMMIEEVLRFIFSEAHAMY